MPTPRSPRPWAAALVALLVTSPALAQVVIQRGGGLIMVDQPADVATKATTPAPKLIPDAPPPATTGPILSLLDGGFLAGDLLDSEGGKTLRWKGAAFAEPLDFPLPAVNAAHWPLPKEPRKPSGAFCFEMAGGDVVYGALLELDDTALIDAAPVGKLRIARANLHRIERWNESADLIYSGPIGLEGWTQTSDKKGWRDESGQPVSDQEATALRGDLKLPPRAAIEMELSWKNTPDFSLALGVEPDSDKADARSYRLEVWDGKLVAAREASSDADVAEIQAVPPGPGRAHIQAFLDQEAGRLTIVSPAGKPLADLKVADPSGKPLGGLALTNNKGDIKLERLRIRRWNGEPFRAVQADRSRLHKTDGSVVYGKVKSYDPAADEFVVATDEGETRAKAKEIASVFLSPPGDPEPRAVRIVTQEGARLSGDVEKVASGAIHLAVPGVKETPRLPVKTLRSLVVAHREEKDKDKKADDAKADGPTGTLVLDGVKLRGRLVERNEKDGAGALAWKAEASTDAGALNPNVSGRIIYREPRPKPNPNNNPNMVRPIVRVRPAPAAGFVQGVFGGVTEGQAQPTGPTTGRRALHLRTGDIVPGEVVKIDEAGVTFKSTLSDSSFIPHEKIKAIELAPEPPATVRLNRTKRDRLLTLPRMQKDSPPTQMIRSKTGDYLRGRILGLDEKTLKVEVRLENKEIPRDRVSRIIWLHPEDNVAKEKPKGNEKDKAQKAEKPIEKPAGPMRVQALRSDGIRLTFTPESFSDSTLAGKSDVLGPCRVKLDEVDQLLIGPEIEKNAATLAYGVWVLHDAIEPKIATAGEDGDGEHGPGTESALVGKPAPDFKLDLLGDDKKAVHLADLKGQVVILDFWATWCGPCLQAMPQVEEVAGEFADKGVKLIAVNLEEDPKQIKAMMERHKMNMTVALDRDGAVALKYQANAIPQTVIIDKDGNVARLYVGGGPKLGERLREALNQVLSGEKPKDKVDAANP